VLHIVQHIAQVEHVSQDEQIIIIIHQRMSLRVHVSRADAWCHCSHQLRSHVLQEAVQHAAAGVSQAARQTGGKE
jgi:hypothetical protein